MKILKGAFFGALIGLGIALIISFFVVTAECWSCTGNLIGGFCTLDPSKCVNDCDDPAARQLSHDFDYVNTFIFSTAICAGIGTVWGIGATIAQENEKAKKRKAEKEKTDAERFEKNKKDLKNTMFRIDSNYSSVINEVTSTFDKIEYCHQKKEEESDKCIKKCNNAIINSEQRLNELLKKYDKNFNDKSN